MKTEFKNKKQEGNDKLKKREILEKVDTDFK
jgi:hypothetical protein